VPFRAIPGQIRVRRGHRLLALILWSFDNACCPPQNTGYPPQQFNSYPPALAAYAQQQNLGLAQVQPQQNLGHNMSVGSSATFLSSAPVAVLARTLQISCQSALDPYCGGRPILLNQHKAGPSQRYEDPFARTGSPVAYQDHPVLRVRNAEPSICSLRGLRRRRSAHLACRCLDHQGRRYDGKGRPLNVGGEKAPLVHLDGGAYQEQPRTPAPPAYRDG
jgi:hypothetical protein